MRWLALAVLAASCASDPEQPQQQRIEVYCGSSSQCQTDERCMVVPDVGAVCRGICWSNADCEDGSLCDNPIEWDESGAPITWGCDGARSKP